MKYIEKDFPIDRLNVMAQKEANSKKPIYQIHKWWARRLGNIFKMIILATFLDYDESKSPEENEEELWEKFYTKTDLGDKIILDPFMGGGTTVVEGIRLGCKVIGVDIHPVAWFITKKEVESVDLSRLKNTFKEIERKVADKIKSYYKTTCPKCGREADVMYVFWVKKVKCGGCGKEVKLFNNFTIARKSKKNNKKERVYYVFCPNCGEIFESSSVKVKCPYCDEEFDASKGYTENGKYTCPYCGHKEEILRAVRREGKIPEAEMFAIEYYCGNKSCGRGYKKVDEEDIKLFEEAKKEFEKRKQELLGKLIPDQEIPKGEKTREPLNYNYIYFYEMFNERQLLCLSTLLNEILKIEDKDIREFMLLTFSNCLNANNMFCKYNTEGRKLEPLFGEHAYPIKNMPVENNVWGTKYGRGTFVKYFGMTVNAKEYCLLNPYETMVVNGESKKQETFDSIVGYLADNFEELLENEKNVLLKSQTSEDLSFIPDKSIDAIITDPPYYDNVMYSELADFFHVWLRLGLKDKYEVFQPEYSPRRREIIKNDAQGKDEKFFLDGLTRVFKECYRVLKDDGLLIFTFHHKESKAWASALKSVLDAGFYILSVYPIHSEARTGVHAGGIKYDAIIVCRKRGEINKTASWEKLKDEIYLKAEETIKTLYESGRNLSDADIFVIAVGKCLELYSKYYPNVFKDGKRVDLYEAINDIEEIVDSLIKKKDRMLLPSDVDEITKLYVYYLVEKDKMSYDELNKRLRTAVIDINTFFNEKLLKKKGNSVILVDPRDRKDYIEEKRRKGKELAIIDKIHYLYLIYEEGRPLIEYLKDLADENIKQICKILYNKTGDEIYSRIAGMINVSKAEGKKIINTTLKDFEK